MITEQDVFNCKGWKVLNNIGPLPNIHNVFLQNWLELKQLFKEIHDDVQISKEIQEKTFTHLQQKIFNYLAASSVLTDTARKVMNRYKGTTFFKEYEKKVAEIFKNNNLAHFIRSLRNYQTHFELAFPLSVRSLDDNKHWDVVIMSDELLAHKEEWKLEAKEFIKNCGEEINLTKIFEEYTNLINAFYLWVYTKFAEYHKNDIIERDQLITEANMSVSPSRINPLNLSSEQCEAVLEELQKQNCFKK